MNTNGYLTLLFGSLFAFCIGGCTGDMIAYKKGQVDALSGEVKFHLATNKTQEVSWKRIKD